VYRFEDLPGKWQAAIRQGGGEPAGSTRSFAAFRAEGIRASGCSPVGVACERRPSRYVIPVTTEKRPGTRRLGS